MTVAAPQPRSRWLPFGDPSRGRRLRKVAAWLGGVALALAVCQLLGVDVTGWLSDLWDTLTSIPLGYLVAGWALQTVQTTLTALGWFAILRAGHPGAAVRYREILAAYAAGVALNGFLPANIGTLMTLLMYVAIVPANFPGVLGGMVVQKLFFTVAGAFVYAYLFLSVPGDFELQLPGPHDHPLLWSSIVLGGMALIVLLARAFWHKLRGLWAKAKRGGAILSRPRDYLLQVVLPSFGAWLA